MTTEGSGEYKEEGFCFLFFHMMGALYYGTEAKNTQFLHETKNAKLESGVTQVICNHMRC